MDTGIEMILIAKLTEGFQKPWKVNGFMDSINLTDNVNNEQEIDLQMEAKMSHDRHT